jgi:branched-subunit amino acid ABC-type transport system permease component
MQVVFSALIAGLTIGSLYGLIGIGYTVIFNATHVFNLAQGDLAMVAIMASYYALDVLHWNEVVTFVTVIPFVVLLALFEERTVVNPLLRRGERGGIAWFISTLGFSLILETVVNLLFGDHAIVAIPSPFPVSGFNLGGTIIGYRQMFVVGTFVAVVIALELFYGRTWLGRAMRATAEDRDASSLTGISPSGMSMMAFALGGLVAAIAGLVMAPLTFSDPSVGLNYTLKGFLALAIGGFGSIRGAIAGALLLGVAEQFWDLYVGSNFEIVAGLALLLIVLLTRPEGLFRTTVARAV